MAQSVGRRIARRRMLQGAAALSLAASAGRAAEPSRPNILFIMADDLGFADLGCYGRRGISTPNIDGLAREGVRLTQAYANSAVCSASRTALITGRYHQRLALGLPEPLGGDERDTLSLPKGRPTLPSLFKAGGYRTALIGKWHLGDGKAGPQHAGYDHFYGFLPGANDYFRRPTEAEAAVKDYAGAPLYQDGQVIQPRGYLTDLLGAEAAREVAATPAGTPFFISLHFNAPHWPWERPQDEARSVGLKALRDSDNGSVAIFNEMVEAMDRAIGEVLAAVQRAGRARDTIVVFTSDNGGERFSDMWPLTGQKGELLEGGIRVPAIVRWPGHIPAGRTSDQVLAGMDWLPTLAAAAGLKTDPAYAPDGQDLLAVLMGSAPAHARTLFWRYKASEQAAVRDGDWKYLKLGGREFLFNLAKDERERADHKAAEAATFKRLRAAYDGWNAGMLPYPLGSGSDNPKSLGAADRY